MSKHEKCQPDTFQVSAVVREWKPPKGNGFTYGFAEFELQGQSLTAFCQAGMSGVAIELGKAFNCTIKKEPRGYKVAEIFVGNLPADLSGLSASVSRNAEKKQILFMAYMGQEFSVYLSRQALIAARLFSVVDGARLKFDAHRVKGRYEVSGIHEPTGAAAVPAPTKEQLQHTVVARAVTAWSGDTSFVTCHFSSDAKAPVRAAVFVGQRLLKSAGIRRLAKHHAELDDKEETVLSNWDSVLKSRSGAEIAGLQIDRVKLLVEWQEHKKAWHAVRVLMPRGTRLPKADGEIVDWIEGVVAGEPKANAPYCKPGSKTPQSAPGAAAEYLIVPIFFKHKTIGQAEIEYSAKAAQFAKAELADKVPVTIQIQGGRDKWYVKRIHCSTPHVKAPDAV